MNFSLSCGNLRKFPAAPYSFQASNWTDAIFCARNRILTEHGRVTNRQVMVNFAGFWRRQVSICAPVKQPQSNFGHFFCWVEKKNALSGDNFQPSKFNLKHFSIRRLFNSFGCGHKQSTWHLGRAHSALIDIIKRPAERMIVFRRQNMSLLVYPKSVRGNSIWRKSILNMGNWHFLVIIILQVCKNSLKLAH